MMMSFRLMSSLFVLGLALMSILASCGSDRPEPTRWGILARAGS